MEYGVLVDTTRCIGCRSCQVSCKNENRLPAEVTQLAGQDTGLTNPRKLSANTFTIVQYHEVDAPEAPGGMRFVFAKRQCMHCDQPACVSACPVTALHKEGHGGVAYDEKKCIGCRYCVWACPFNVPTAEWNTLAPRIRKCDLCADRVLTDARLPELNGEALGGEARKRLEASYRVPACIKACTTGALLYGRRADLLEEAHRRIDREPERYHPHVYGEHEVGGTSYLYLAAVPFDRIGFRTDLGTRPFPALTATALGFVPPAVVGLGIVLGGLHLLAQRKAFVAAEERERAESARNGGGTP
ncbi:MAG TPA: 4Fe-4S dicluster domain-containing protein [Myxococcota bacterium]|nr:4Fe-4S dicluster domain-containing protein [Myxococcota bacterium]